MTDLIDTLTNQNLSLQAEIRFLKQDIKDMRHCILEMAEWHLTTEEGIQAVKRTSKIELGRAAKISKMAVLNCRASGCTVEDAARAGAWRVHGIILETPSWGK